MTQVLRSKGYAKENYTMSSVSLKTLNLEWLTASPCGETGEQSFKELVRILNLPYPKNQAFFSSMFVTCILDHYWDEYKEAMKMNHFRPFILYMISMLYFMSMTLSNANQNSQWFMNDTMFTFVIGFCAVMIAHQARTEYCQLKQCKLVQEYLLSYWNFIDVIHLSMNSFLIVMHCIDDSYFDLSLQRVWAAFAVCFLWAKLFDWLRLFDGTAFFIRLMLETVHGT